MARRGFDFIVVPAQPPTRVALFAIRVVDAVTLETIRQGVSVEAVGLRGRPIVNGSGLFVWLDEDLSKLERVAIDPGSLPFEAVTRERDDFDPPLDKPPRLATIELPPRADYPFPTGITGLRGRLLVSKVSDPVAGAEINLQWRTDETEDWINAPTISHTTPQGDFVTTLRLGRGQAPMRDPEGLYLVRLQARRDGTPAHTATPFPLPPGRISDPTDDDPLTFFWDELES